MKNKKMNKIEELNNQLKEMCERNGLKLESFQNLKDFYTQQLKWSEEQAIEYIINLFDNGTIKLIQTLKNQEGEQDGEVE